jgi:SAM-dependent MidA family methyltransferase
VTDAIDNLTLREGNPCLIAEVREEIQQRGCIPFARFMELALYHPEHGYYMGRERRPGRDGDFLTAPELHPFFGLALARQVAECWDRLGQPDTFTVLEYGSNVGGMAYDSILGLIDARPELRQRFSYRLNEINPHRTSQALSAMAEAGLSEIVAADNGSEPITGVVLANEFADAMPVHRLRWTGTGFEETWVAWDDNAGFVERPGPLSPAVSRFDPVGYLTSAGLDLDALPENARFEVSPATATWIWELARRLDRGYALVIDYGYPASELYSGRRLEGTLRVHGKHQVTDNPYQAVGKRDLTAHVDFTLIESVAHEAGLSLAGLTTQADFLANAGLGDLLVNYQTETGVTIDDYYRAQAAVFRLIDPAGMGRFRVLGLAKGAPVDPPLCGFAEPLLPERLVLREGTSFVSSGKMSGSMDPPRATAPRSMS